jgi:ribose 5-phosphate isomerase RpiB
MQRRSGVPVFPRRLLDPVVPATIKQWVPIYHKPEDYASTHVEVMNEYVSPGDTVVIVGGGVGVSAVAAAERTDSTGSVTVFEASSDGVALLTTTVEHTGYSDVIDIEHAVVGSVTEYSERVYGATGDGTVIPPEKLPACDLLELDCEGAEIEILEAMTIRPPILTVESHSFLGSDKQEIIAVLRSKGYEIVDISTENRERGIHIITAALSESEFKNP